MPTVKLDTLAIKSTMGRPVQKRVFTDDEWSMLKTKPVSDLKQRQQRGMQIINLLAHPAMMNMTPARANALVSNLKFQIEAIQNLIDSKENSNG